MIKIFLHLFLWNLNLCLDFGKTQNLFVLFILCNFTFQYNKHQEVIYSDSNKNVL